MGFYVEALVKTAARELALKKKLKQADIEMENEKKINKLAVLNSYLACALWTDEMDSFSISDIGASTIATARKDIDEFLTKAANLLPEWNSEEIGHDFWLTRNHHGSGFCDRGYEFGDELTTIAQKFKSLNVWKSELDVIYFE